ncbi:pyocin knob domain-containing protein [Aeromonas jandaei]|uniref:pyocin knob domain-containing protein n=1 Tax=Aeromonas jandaei TaxID=650 RepID=UPI00196A8C99|nr:pyocin knob domain-containing protein [Aeromonas jandaei]
MQPIMPPVSTPDNLFHDGDPTQGIEGTIVTAEHLNNEQGAIRDVQQELINVLALAAMEPDPAKQDQLAEAIAAIIGGSLPATFVTSVNTQTGDVTLGAGDVGAAPANHNHPGTLPNPIALASEDLNTLVTPNVYRQDSDANATLELNYPEAKSGSLIVTGGAGAQQRYHVYNTSRIYTRAQYDVNAFTPWVLTYNTGNKPTLDELGAAAAGHGHTPEQCGAAPAIHGHTPGDCGAAAAEHGHSPEQCGAAPAVHSHDWGSIANPPQIVSDIRFTEVVMRQTPEQASVGEFGSGIIVTAVAYAEFADVCSQTTRQLQKLLNGTSWVTIEY